jgi:hypothetical protein
MWLVVVLPITMIAMLLVLAWVEDHWLSDQPHQTIGPEPAQESTALHLSA